MNGINISLGNVINVIVNIQLFWNLLILEKIKLLIVVNADIINRINLILKIIIFITNINSF